MVPKLTFHLNLVPKSTGSCRSSSVPKLLVPNIDCLVLNSFEFQLQTFESVSNKLNLYFTYMKHNIKSKWISILISHNIHWISTILLIRINSYKIGREASEWRPSSSNFLCAQNTRLWHAIGSVFENLIWATPDTVDVVEAVVVVSSPRCWNLESPQKPKIGLSGQTYQLPDISTGNFPFISENHAWLKTWLRTWLKTGPPRGSCSLF